MVWKQVRKDVWLNEEKYLGVKIIPTDKGDWRAKKLPITVNYSEPSKYGGRGSEWDKLFKTRGEALKFAKSHMRKYK